MIPEWVSNEKKYLRAVKEAGEGATEEKIQALYIKYGGLVVGKPETQRGVEEGQVSIAVLPAEEREKLYSKKKKK